MSRVKDWCKNCGETETDDNPICYSGRGWCFNCEHEEEAEQIEERRRAAEAREAFMALPDDEKWDRLYDAVFEKED